MNQNVEPSPTQLVTPIDPPMSSTSCFEIARPSPVPPYFRVVEASAWLNFSKMEASFSGGIPMPLSLTDIFISVLRVFAP